MDKRTLDLCVHYIRHNLCKDPNKKFNEGNNSAVPAICRSPKTQYKRCTVCDEFLKLDYILPNIYYKDTAYGIKLKSQQSKPDDKITNIDSNDEKYSFCLFD